MVKQAIEFVSIVFGAVSGWLEQIWNATEATEPLLGIMVVVFSTRFLILPIVGTSVNAGSSDKARTSGKDGEK